ncbi:MAG: hypothetical protein AAGC92_14285 [Pseudomonadota bacterium]
MPQISASKYLVTATWDDAPHLDEVTKAEMMAAYPPHMRDARTKGVPSLGAGAIYPVPIESVEREPQPIPDWWPRAYALDVGWNCTAALWGAWDPTNGALFLYSEYKAGEVEPSVHAAAIRARGEWIPGLIDSAARGRNQSDGEQLTALYRDLGLRLTETRKGPGSVEAGLYACWQKLSEKRLLHSNLLRATRAEYRVYRRDEKGRVVKEDDHLMDCMRYLETEGRNIAIVRPVKGGQPTQTTVGDRRAGY